MTDLCIVTDATGSMGAFLEAISATLPQYLNIAHLTNAFSRIGVLAYYDYSDKHITRWSGWYTSLKDLSKFADGLRPAGGGDAPEAAKTAIVDLLTYVEKPTIVVWYADAPPHHKTNKAAYSNQGLELRKLGAANWDWVELCGRLAKREIVVYPIINTQDFKTAAFYMWMARATGGKTLLTGQTTAHTISSVTINLILALLGSTHVFENVHELEYTEESPEPTDENTSPWLPSATHKSLSISLKIPSVNTHTAVAKDLKALIKVFKTDESYQETVFSVFDELLTPRHIESLTYNSIFGTFWREICKRRKDPRREEALQKINKALAGLSPAQFAIVKKWLDESYNNEEEILEMIAVASSQFPAIVCDIGTGVTKPTRAQEILEIAHSCNAQTLAKISALMTGLHTVSTTTQRYLPLSLDDETLFSTLPHLMFPGTIVTRRPAIIFAVIAVLTHNAILEERALRFLKAAAGTWYDPEFAENFAFGFVKLMLRVPEALTDKERVEFTHLRNLCGFMINSRTTLDLVLPRRVLRTVGPDYKYPCSSCHHERSFTLMTESGKCGLCECGVGETNETAPAGKSYWYECRQCFAHYAVVEPDMLNVEPKCHYCRTYGETAKPPVVACFSCKNRFIDPSKQKDSLKSRIPWICPGCKDAGKPLTETSQTTLAKLFAHPENKVAISKWIGLAIPRDYDVFNNKTLFQIKDVVKPATRPEDPSYELIHKGKPVLNCYDVLNQIQTWVECGYSERDDCMLCFETLSKTALHNTCGRKGCKTWACKSCLDAWYGAMQPGALLNPNNMHCPFCKRFPSAKILMKHNPRGCELIRRGIPEFDGAWYYGWCLRCYRPAQHLEKVCGVAGEEPVLRDFVCEPCRAATAEAGVLVDARECPHCDVMTQKAGGCDHITCYNCGEHWCWRCGMGGFTGQTVYGHIYNCRGDGRVGEGHVHDHEYYSDDDDW